MNNLHKEQASSNLLLHRILSKIEVLEANNSKIHQAPMTSIYLDSDFLTQFPIKSFNWFCAIEERIRNELNFVSKLVYSIYYN